ncbi:LOW QUALITY PROTEIN: toll-like receptor 4 [Gigantopelta aegis]|uniref:LOW QUALITY PROTEIN: toll-like receptor 4 n=1 Tax=Gigantopelta aegis TaxID=1735272 RepID=UPI001B88B25F|nr:LOW QUALITY PROTEIN: toll-like receptor 4 [Gigantopelta aegis]
MHLKLIIWIVIISEVEADVIIRRNRPGTPIRDNPCTVIKTVANCSHQELSGVPSRLPKTITVLLMDHNKLFSLPSHEFSKFKNLTDLDISNNVIHYVSDDAFHGVTRLQRLHMENNNVQCPQKALSVLHSLEELYVDGSINITFGEYFQNLSKLTNLTLFGSLDGCKIKHIYNYTFKYVPHLKLLNISNCDLKTIDSGSFLPLRHIEELDISNNNHLNFGNFQNATYGLINSSIRVLRANGIVTRWSVCNILKDQHTQHLRNTRLEKMYFDHNRLECIDLGALQNLPDTLWYVSTRFNRFTNGPYIVALEVMRKVTHLYLGNDDSKSMPHLPYPRRRNSVQFESDSSQSGLKHMWNTTRSIPLTPPILKSSYYSPISISLPPHLQLLQLTCKKMVFDITWLRFKPNNLTTLILNCNLLSRWIGPVEGLDNLQHLDLSNNLARFVSTHFFTSFPNLRLLNISFNFLGSMLYQANQSLILDNLTSLEVLDMSLNDIGSLPENIFRDLVSVKVLNVSTNVLYLDLPLRVAHMKNLQLLDLSNNQIRWFSETLMRDLDTIAKSTNITVQMILNPISCTCDNLDFLSWMRSSKIIFLDVYNYTCAFENETFSLIGTFEDTVIRLQNECKGYLILVLGSVFGGILVFVIMVGAIIYRYRWNLRYWYYAARRNHQNLMLLDTDEDSLTFDAFVSYADKDREFVNEMKNSVETEAGLKLNIGDRNFDQDKQIPSNILSAIQTSRKTVAILSSFYLEDKQCEYELQIANIESIKTGRDVLVMIMYEDISTKKLPKEVSYRLKTESYITYPHNEDEDRIKLFWRQVITALTTN